MTPEWEYHVELLGSFWRGARPGEIQALLNEAAADGWEPVELAPIQNSSRMMLILRRPAEGRRPKGSRGWP